MKKKDWIKVALLAVATSCGAGVAYGQSGLHGSGAFDVGGFRSGTGAMSQQSYMPSAGCDSCDGGTCEVGGYGLDCGDECGVGSAPGFFGGAEWLTWQVNGGSQNYAVALNPRTLTERYTKDAAQKGNGVRGKVGYRTSSMWDVAVGYTYFKADDSGGVSSDSDPSSLFVATRSRANLATQNAQGPQAVSYQDKLEMQALDFEVGRKLQYGNFDFRPFGGFRWLELDAKQGGGYQYAPNGVATGLPTRLASSDLTSSSLLKGYGLRMGAEASVDLFGGFRAYGRGAASVLVGEMKSKATEINEQDGQVLNRDVKETLAVPGLEAAAGLAWRFDMLEVRGGYELNTIFNGTNHNGRRDDLLFHGFFAGASINY